jgi:hypothetical protein
VGRQPERLHPGTRLDASPAHRPAQPLILADDFSVVVGFLELEYSYAVYTAAASRLSAC